MKVLVVGASGYLGYWVTRALATAGDEVVELSRRGSAHHGTGVTGDVTAAGLGLAPADREALADVAAVVCCFGSVDWDADPAAQVNLHVAGVRNVLDLAASLPSAPRVVHTSSLLALGRAEGTVGNRELSLGQSFRTWYEYAKYRAEAVARREERVPVSIVRFGPLLGPAPAELIPLTGGPLQALPQLLQGMPLVLQDAGRFPVYVGDVAAAGQVVADLVHAERPPAVCTYFDPARPTLARILHELCLPWGTVPRLVRGGSRSRRLQRLLAGRLGLTDSSLEYTAPLFTLHPDVLADLPGPAPKERPAYIVETAEALRSARRVLSVATEVSG